MGTPDAPAGRSPICQVTNVWPERSVVTEDGSGWALTNCSPAGRVSVMEALYAAMEPVFV